MNPYKQRFDDLRNQAQKLIKSAETRNENEFDSDLNDAQFFDPGFYEYMDPIALLKWKTKAKNLLTQVCGENSHYIQLFEQYHPTQHLEDLLHMKTVFEAVQEDYTKGFIIPASNSPQATPKPGQVIQGNQFNNYGITAAMGPHSTGTINFEQQWAATQNQVDLNVLANELEQLRKHLQQSASSSSDYQQLALLADAEEQAKKREGGKAMEVLSKVGKGALGVAKDIGTEVVAKVIAKSMGLEP